METPGKSDRWLGLSDSQPHAEMFTTQQRERESGGGGCRMLGSISQCPPLTTSIRDASCFGLGA